MDKIERVVNNDLKNIQEISVNIKAVRGVKYEVLQSHDKN